MAQMIHNSILERMEYIHAQKPQFDKEIRDIIEDFDRMTRDKVIEHTPADNIERSLLLLQPLPQMQQMHQMPPMHKMPPMHQMQSAHKPAPTMASTRRRKGHNKKGPTNSPLKKGGTRKR
jgi:hypothetical protein